MAISPVGKIRVAKSRTAKGILLAKYQQNPIGGGWGENVWIVGGQWW
jgi:hypothetical protein